MSRVPKQGDQTQPKTTEQQAAPPAPSIQLPSAQGPAQSSGCPGTSEPKLSCDVVIAKATEAQTTAAFEAVDAAWAGLWLGLVTALVAGLAAKFANDAARAATKSYQAFVAAEDAHLVVEFPDGTLTESFLDGVRQEVNYHLSLSVTNIGRSTARLHYFAVPSSPDRDRVELDRTLGKDENFKFGWGVMVPADKPFTLVVSYSSPIMSNAMLVITAIPEETHDRRRLRARIIGSEILDMTDAKKRQQRGANHLHVLRG